MLNSTPRTILVARISLILTAVVYFTFGIVFLVNPEFVTQVGVILEPPTGFTEIRGFYGGQELGIAAFFGIAATRQGWFIPALVLQIFALGGMAAGRLVGIVLDGWPESIMWALVAAESIGSLFGMAALYLLTSNKNGSTLLPHP